MIAASVKGARWIYASHTVKPPAICDPLKPRHQGTQTRCAERARKLQAFLSQPFFVAEEFTGIPAGHVSLADTLGGCEAIMADHCDDLPEKALRYIGALDEAKG